MADLINSVGQQRLFNMPADPTKALGRQPYIPLDLSSMIPGMTKPSPYPYKLFMSPQEVKSTVMASIDTRHLTEGETIDDMWRRKQIENDTGIRQTLGEDTLGNKIPDTITAPRSMEDSIAEGGIRRHVTLWETPRGFHDRGAQFAHGEGHHRVQAALSAQARSYQHGPGSDVFVPVMYSDNPLYSGTAAYDSMYPQNVKAVPKLDYTKVLGKRGRGTRNNVTGALMAARKFVLGKL